MRNDPAFIVSQFAIGNRPIDSKFGDLVNYLSHNSIVLSDNEMFISGRACEDIKVGDVLVTEKNSQINVFRLHVYDRRVDSISKGMTCGIYSNISDELFIDGQFLFLRTC